MADDRAMRHRDSKPESSALFMKRGLAAIEETQRLGNGLPAKRVIAMLDEKLRLARQMKLQAMQKASAHFPID